MENTNEIKTRSIRADNESFEKFKIISEKFQNQAQALEALISVYEVESSKSIMPERQTEIETFTIHMQKLNEIYNHSLLMNQDAETRIRAEFERQLISKDTSILELQERLKEAVNNSKEASVKLKDIDILNERIKSLENELAISNSITKSLTTLTDDYKELTEENELLKSELKQQEIQNMNLRNKIENMEYEIKQNELNQERRKSEYEKEMQYINEKANLEKDRAILSIKEVYSEKIAEMNENYQKRINDLLTQREQLEEKEKQEKQAEKQTPKTRTRKTANSQDKDTN